MRGVEVGLNCGNLNIDYLYDRVCNGLSNFFEKYFSIFYIFGSLLRCVVWGKCFKRDDEFYGVDRV